MTATKALALLGFLSLAACKSVEPIAKPLYSAERFVDERQSFTSPPNEVQGRVRWRHYSDVGPRWTRPPQVAPIGAAEAIESALAPRASWPDQASFIIVKDQVPGPLGHTDLDPSPGIDELLEKQLMARGFVPLDRSAVLGEMQREVWFGVGDAILDSDVWFAINDEGKASATPDKPELFDAYPRTIPSLACGIWSPIMVQLKPLISNGILNSNGLQRGDVGARSGQFMGARLSVLVDGPEFATVNFETEAFPEWSTPTREVPDWTARATPTGSLSAFQEEATGHFGQFFDYEKNAVWGFHTVRRWEDLDIAEYMQWKYAHLLDDASEPQHCQDCFNELGHAQRSELTLPPAISKYATAKDVLSRQYGDISRSPETKAHTDMLRELEKAVRPSPDKTPWQEVNKNVPFVPAVWICPKCWRLWGVRFLAGFVPEGQATSRNEEMTYVSWAYTDARDGVYPLATPHLLEAGFASIFGSLEGTEAIEHASATVRTNQDSCAVLIDGVATILPLELVVKKAGETAQVPSCNADGQRSYKQQPTAPGRPGATLSEVWATFGCRIIENESSRVLGLIHLKISYRQVMKRAFAFPLSGPTVVVDAWPGIANQREAILREIAKRVAAELPKPQ